MFWAHKLSSMNDYYFLTHLRNMLWLHINLILFQSVKAKSFMLNIAQQNLGGKAKVSRFSPIPSAFTCTNNTGSTWNLCSTEGFTFTGFRNAVNQYTWQTGNARELMLLEVAQGLEKYLVLWWLAGNSSGIVCTVSKDSLSRTELW